MVNSFSVFWNNVTTADRDSIELPNIFSVARAHGYSTAAFFSKAKFQPLQLPGTLDYSQAPGGWFGKWSSERTVSDVAKYLADARPNVLFVHLTDPDTAGHRSGWMSSTYGRAVLAADRALNELLEVAGHLLVRDRRPLAQIGRLALALGGDVAHAAMDALGQLGEASLVEVGGDDCGSGLCETAGKVSAHPTGGSGDDDLQFG